MITNKNINTLKRELKKVVPIHDYPIGTIHPYWARKPLNIIDQIITNLSKPGDVVLDPFMGSGTTVFSALKNRRKVIGSDINPLSTFITTELLQIGSSKTVLIDLRTFLTRAEDKLLPMFQIANDRFIERQRYTVEGEFEHGRFNLIGIETISKALHKVNTGSERRIEAEFTNPKIPKTLKRYLKFPIDFSKSNLMPNSRIAIPTGANLSQFFTTENIICINFLVDLSDKISSDEQVRQACKFLISSAIPLLRLSDKKASSQWPYWRPKDSLTSRNPLIVLRKKFNKIKSGIDWLVENNIHPVIGTIDKITTKSSKTTVAILETPIQNLKLKLKPKLILTDPPYTDHVPYLEYSAVWNMIFRFKISKAHYSNEIVNSDAPQRKLDTIEYKDRLGAALRKCSELIHQDGLIVWFYQDLDLTHWLRIYQEAKNCDLQIVEVIPISKQRRSMKTVMSPGKTLDGDLLLIFRRKGKVNLKNIARKSTFKRSQNNYDEYVKTIRDVLLNGNDKTKPKGSKIMKLIRY